MENDWIELNLPYGSCYDDDFNIMDSFTKRELNNPGTLIETEHGQFLIGHMNDILGVCDCCKMFSKETIVLRYKVLAILSS